MKTNQTPSEVEEKIDEILLNFAEVINNHPDFNWEKHTIPNARQQLTALIEQAKVEARLEEVENFKALDQIGTLERLNREVLYIDRRIATLTTKESEVNNE